MDVAPAVIDLELSAKLIETLEKILRSISCWIQQEKDAVVHEEDICSNYCASLSTIMGDDKNSMELCIFLFSSKMIEITKQTFGFTCSGQVRGVNSIIAVYPRLFASTLTLHERLNSDTIKLLSIWERKRVNVNVCTPIVEGKGETTCAIEFSIIDKLGGVDGTLKSLPQITSYAQKLNAAYRESLKKLAVLKLEHEKLSEQHRDFVKRHEYRDTVNLQKYRESVEKLEVSKLDYQKLIDQHSDSLNMQEKKRKSNKIKDGMANASSKRIAEVDNGCFMNEKIEIQVTQRLVKHIKDDCNTPQKIHAVMKNLVVTFPSTQTDITCAKLILADNFITSFKVLYTLVQCFPKQKDFSPDAVNFRELEGKLKNVLLMAVGPTGKQGHSCKNNSGVLKLLGINETSKFAKCATDRRTLLANSCHTHMQIDQHNKGSVETVGHKVLHRFFQQPTRKHRKDKMTETDRRNIEEAWYEMSEVSPNTNDQITCRHWNGTETKHFRYNCFHRIVDIKNHLLNVKHLTYSDSSVRLHKPFNVKKGKNDTCMCSLCENSGLLQKAVMRNSKVFDRPTRLVKAYRVLSLLAKAIKLRYTLKKEQKLVSVRHCFIVVTTLYHCFYDYPMRTIVDVCRGAHRSQICHRLMCNNALPKYGARNKRECGRSMCLGEVKKSDICARCSKSRNMLLHEDVKSDERDRIGKLLNELGFRECEQKEKDWTEADQISYSAWANEEGTKVESLLKVWVKPPIEFVAYFKEKMYEYAHHINVLTRQRNNAVLFQKNAQPHQLVADIDFSQNFEHTASHRNQIQSAHWTGESTTLFTTVFRYLDLSIYQDTISPLLEGDEVSFFDKNTNLYHHAIIVQDWSPSATDTASCVKIRLSDIEVFGEDVLLTARQTLHRRVWIAEPHITASNDKQHDTSFVQHFLQHVALGANGFVKSHPVLKDQISEFHIHSDGAPGHFKQKYTLQSLNDLLTRNLSNGIKRIVWEFGCPGHGKGVWDGIGGVVKNTTKEYILRNNIVVQSAHHAFEIMCLIFTSKESHDSYDKRKDIKCKKWHFIWVSEQETAIIRASQPKPKNTVDDNEFKKEVDGIKANFVGYKVGTRNIFFYEPLGNANQIALRVNGCCCPVCMCSNRETEQQNLEYTWGQGTTRYKEIISTVLPEIFSLNGVTKEKINCMFGQIWQTQMLRVKLTPNAIGEVGDAPVHGMILDAAPEEDAAPAIGDQEMPAPEVAAIGGCDEVDATVSMIPELSNISGTEVQHEIEHFPAKKSGRKRRRKKDSSVADMVHWASCEKCEKWRVVNKPYADTDVFQCSDVASYDHVHANCDVPSEWIEPIVAEVQNKKTKR